MAMRRNENSLICPREEPARKLFFFVCPIMPKIIIVISGLMKRINKLNTIIMGISLAVHAKFTCDHNKTKYITIKKSLSDLTLLVISYLKLELDSAIPAMSVPNSIPSQK